MARKRPFRIFVPTLELAAHGRTADREGDRKTGGEPMEQVMASQGMREGRPQLPLAVSLGELSQLVQDLHQISITLCYHKAGHQERIDQGWRRRGKSPMFRDRLRWRANIIAMHQPVRP